MRPQRIRILGKAFKVTNGPLPDDLNGECDTDAQTLAIRDGQPLDSEQDTLLHECIHAIDEAMGTKLKESQVKGIATGLLAVMKDNPRLMTYLRKR